MPLDLDGKETLGEAMFGRRGVGRPATDGRLVMTFDKLRRHPGSTLPNKWLRRRT